MEIFPLFYRVFFGCIAYSSAITFPHGKNPPLFHRSSRTQLLLPKNFCLQPMDRYSLSADQNRTPQIHLPRTATRPAKSVSTHQTRLWQTGKFHRYRKAQCPLSLKFPLLLDFRGDIIQHIPPVAYFYGEIFLL